MRKYFIILTLVLLGGGIHELSAQPILTPYQYRERWFFSWQAGPTFFVSENSSTFADYKRYDRFSFYNEAILGYYFTDAHEIRFSWAYARRASVYPPVFGFLPYTFNSAQTFVDYVINWHPLGEYNTAYNPQMYVGLGAAVTYGFSKPEYNPSENLTHAQVDAILPPVHALNIVPGLRFGVIFEYDFTDNYGLTLDIGGQLWHDRFNGQNPDNWPIDLAFNGAFGFVYHFEGKKK